MAAAMNSPLRMVSQRDQLSFALAALALACIMALAQIQLPSESDLPPPNIAIHIETPPPQEVKAPPEPIRQMQATKPVERVSKATPSESLATSNEGFNPPAAVMLTRPAAATAPATPHTTVSQPEVHRHDIEKEFEGKIRALVEASKRYPTGREASLQKPQGVVMACAVLQRSGSLQEIKIQNSSGYPILDNAAKRLLANLQYPNLPDDFFPGKAQHMFCVNLDYKVPA